MREWLVGLCVVFGLFGVVHAGGGFDHSDFDQIIRECVRGESVDYALVREQYQDQLKNYLKAINQVDPSSLTRDERLALYINLYNATMIKEVVKRQGKLPKWKPSWQDFTVFNEPTVRVNGKWMSLNKLENELIRPQFGEPRIHVALVCGAVSCPPLVPTAYTADNLDEMLEENMLKFVNDQSRNEISVEHGHMKLSQIFKWYAEDFGGPKGVVAYIDGYHEADLSQFSVDYVKYSWELNGVR